MKINKCVPFFFLLLMAMPFASQAGLDDITVMALGPVDGRAVIKTADGKMQVLKVGDKVQGTKAIVKQVLTDRLVVTDLVDSKPPIEQDVWIYKPSKPGEKSRIQRLDRNGPSKQAMKVEVMNAIGSSGEEKGKLKIKNINGAVNK